jgi:hypothetical protein
LRRSRFHQVIARRRRWLRGADAGTVPAQSWLKLSLDGAMRMRGFCWAGAIIAILACPPADAMECEAGLVPVYRQESAGLPDEDWRDFYVFDLTPDGAQVHYHDPSSDTAAWLEDVSGGTNVPTRGLVPAAAEDGPEGHLYRFLAIREDETGEVTEALLVDMTVYWPECATRERVDAWTSLAGTPRH